MNTISEAVESVFRDQYGRVTASLIGYFGDFDVAEEAIQDAFVTAIARWPRDGVPDNPAAWITQTAKRKAIDNLRREGVRKRKYAASPWRPVPMRRSSTCSTTSRHRPSKMSDCS